MSRALRTGDKNKCAEALLFSKFGSISQQVVMIRFGKELRDQLCTQLSYCKHFGKSMRRLQL